MLVGVAAMVFGVGVWALRSATMTVHDEVPPTSRTVVVVDAAVRQADAGHGVQEMAWAKAVMCRTEIRRSELVGGLEPAGPPADRFRMVLEPGLSEADRTQLRGCLEDWNLDHVQVDVIRIDDVEARAAPR